jgi:mannose/cellobiose epimerase-like protein (N-acyl-D-glucosamine 2-epimerase family)
VPEAAVRFTDWLHESTIPYWLDHGVDRSGGGFHEKLGPDRQPVLDAGKRIMVQARQLFVAADHALLTGSADARTAAGDALSFMRDHCRHPEGGWRFRVARDGAPQDDTRDLYAHAFVLFALAWHHRLDPNGGAAREATTTLAFLDAQMAHPSGGYYETLDSTGRAVNGTRRQNPHMHLFEAFLEWAAISDDPVWRTRADAMAALFEKRFGVDGTLREFFADDLRPLENDKGRLVEPGHHYEWYWLLRRHELLTGDARLAAAADQLYRFAERYGIDPETGGIIDTVDCAGAVVRDSRRLWPQTEAIKAHASRLAVTAGAAARLAAQTESLLSSQHDGMPEGGWREHLAANGAPLTSDLPASSLYHLAMADAELRRVRAESS